MTDPLNHSRDLPAGDSPPPVIMARPVIAAMPPAYPCVPPPVPPRFGDVGSRARAAVELLVLFVTFFAAQIVAHLLLSPFDTIDQRWMNIVESVCMGGMILVAVAAVLLLGGRPPSTIGWRSDALWVDVVLGIAFTVAVIVSMIAVATLLLVFAPNLFDEMQRAPEAIRNTFPRMPPALLLLLCGWVAVFEEVVFRGFLLTRLRVIVRSWPVAVAGGSLLFALPHSYQGPVAVGLVFVLGLMLGAVFAWRRSLAPVIVWHFLFNGVQFFALYYGSSDWA